MKLTSKIVIPAFALALIAGAGYSASAFAQSADGTSDYPPMIQDFVDKFGLNETEVETYFDNVREDHRAEMQANYEGSLDEAIASGDITEDQKNLILEKKAEIRAERDQQRAELEQWAEDNGIDMEYLHEGHGMMGKGHREGGMHR